MVFLSEFPVLLNCGWLIFFLGGGGGVVVPRRPFFESTKFLAHELVNRNFLKTSATTSKIRGNSHRPFKN